MIDFDSTERIVIRDLFLSAAGLHLFTFYRRYKLTPDQVVQVLEKLKHEGFVISKGERIELTPIGRKWVTDNRSQFIILEKPWRKPPDEFVVPQLPINEPYIPNIPLLDKELLPDKWKQDKE